MAHPNAKQLHSIPAGIVATGTTFYAITPPLPGRGVIQDLTIMLARADAAFGHASLMFAWVASLPTSAAEFLRGEQLFDRLGPFAASGPVMIVGTDTGAITFPGPFPFTPQGRHLAMSFENTSAVSVISMTYFTWLPLAKTSDAFQNRRATD